MWSPGASGPSLSGSPSVHAAPRPPMEGVLLLQPGPPSPGSWPRSPRPDLLPEGPALAPGPAGQTGPGVPGPGGVRARGPHGPTRSVQRRGCAEEDGEEHPTDIRHACWLP